MTFQTDGDVIEFNITGTVTLEEYDAAIPEMERLIAEHGKLSAVTVIHDFKHMELGALWRDLTWGVGHMSKLRRGAVVTDSGWIGTMTRASSTVLHTQLRAFGMDQLDAARAWVREG